MGRTSLLARIQHEYLDVDGYWIELKPGWILDGVHQIHCDSKREARSWLSSIESCDCADCKEQPGYQKNPHAAALECDPSCGRSVATWHVATCPNAPDWLKTNNPHAVALGRLGGSVKSERKTAAVRENAKKGGRPRGRHRKPKARTNGESR